MGLKDTLSGFTKGKKPQIKGGVDRAADAIDDKVPDHADKVHEAAEAAKGAVDKLPD